MVVIHVPEDQDTLILGFFFVKDRIKKGKLYIEHFPTALMIADYVTKPLQVKNFKCSEH